MDKKKFDITSAGAPIFDDTKAQKRMSRQIDAQVKNSDSKDVIKKMKSGMTSCQVTPGTRTTKNHL